MAWQERRHRWAMARGAAKWRLLRRLRYLWCDAPTDWVELLSAALSATFAMVLAYRGNSANALAYAPAYALLAALASACKAVGVLGEVWALRVAGALLGLVFWTTIAVVFVRSIPGSISWLCFAVLSLAHFWLLWRRGREGR